MLALRLLPTHLLLCSWVLNCPRTSTGLWPGFGDPWLPGLPPRLRIFPNHRLQPVPRHMTCRNWSRDIPALSIPTWRGPGSKKQEAFVPAILATWVNKGLGEAALV